MVEPVAGKLGPVQAERTKPSNEAKEAKRSYRTPELVEWGSLKELTQGAPQLTTDASEPGTMGTFF